MMGIDIKKEDIQKTNKHMKRYSLSLARKMKIKTIRYYFILTRIAKILKKGNNMYWQ